MKKYYNSIGLSYLSQDDLLRWLKQYTETPSTIYDEAMDAASKIPGYGGSDHRLFDGGHDPLGALESVRNASDTDTLTNEVIGYVLAMFKDMSTVKGMPFFKYDKEWYKETSDWVTSNIPGASKDWLKDLMTYDSFEILSSSLGAISIVFCLKKDDIESVSRILGSMSLIAIIGANPLMGIAVITLCAYSFLLKKNKLDKAEFLKGTGVSGIACIVFSTLGLPVIVELIIFIAIMKIIEKKSISAKEIQKHLYNLSSTNDQLIPMMVGAESAYQKLLGGYSEAIDNAEKINEIEERDLDKRNNMSDLLDKMK